jgi:hypothetical protein
MCPGEREAEEQNSGGAEGQREGENDFPFSIFHFLFSIFYFSFVY